jgi:cell division septum initiation protein DivIVA
MNDYTLFKQVLKGFDKDEVLAYIDKQDEENSKTVAALEKEIKRRDRIIGELKNRIVAKDEQVDRLQDDIRNKYQKYIDNYNQIGDLVYESKMKSDQILSDAHVQANKVLADADEEAKRRVTGVQGEIDAKLTDGKKKYLAVQDEMNEIVDLFNQMQRKFMQSYKEVHEIIQSMPASLDDINISSAEEDDYDDDTDTIRTFSFELRDDDFDLDDDDDDEDVKVIGTR